MAKQKHLVFRTDKNDAASHELAQIGALGPHGRGGVAIERAKEHMVELQNDKGKPLSGKELEAAAERFAEQRGFVVDTVDDDGLLAMSGEWGLGEVDPLSAVREEQAKREREAEAAAVTLPDPEDVSADPDGSEPAPDEHAGEDDDTSSRGRGRRRS